MTSTDIVIVSSAMSASNGLDTAHVCASTSAGLTMTSQLKWSGNNFAPVIMAAIPDNCFLPLTGNLDAYAPLTFREKRLLLLTRLLLPEIFQPVRTLTPTLIIGLPDEIPHPNQVFKGIQEQLELEIDDTYSDIVMKGRAGGLAAIHEACRLLREEKVELVIAGGIDTYKDFDLLGNLNMDLRLKTATSRDGFIPGEGACLFYLMKETRAWYWKLDYLCRIRASVLGFEPGHFNSSKPYTGSGLNETLEKLFNNCRPSQGIKTVYSTMNAESYWAKEWGNAFIRQRAFMDPACDMVHPADCFGDTGAASGPLLTGCAMKAMEWQFAESPILVYASSDHGERAALFMEPPKPPTR